MQIYFITVNTSMNKILYSFTGEQKKKRKPQNATEHFDVACNVNVSG